MSDELLLDLIKIIGGSIGGSLITGVPLWYNMRVGKRAQEAQARKTNAEAETEATRSLSIALDGVITSLKYADERITNLELLMEQKDSMAKEYEKRISVLENALRELIKAVRHFVKANNCDPNDNLIKIIDKVERVL